MKAVKPCKRLKNLLHTKKDSFFKPIVLEASNYMYPPDDDEIKAFRTYVADVISENEKRMRMYGIKDPTANLGPPAYRGIEPDYRYLFHRFKKIEGISVDKKYLK